MAGIYDLTGMANYGLVSPNANLAELGGGQGFVLPTQTSVLGGGNAAANGMFGGGLGWNMPTAQLALGGLQSLGNLWGAFQANKLARDQLAFTKDITNTNVNNQIKSYNTALEDRARTRAFSEGRDQATADAYIDKNRLVR